MVDLDVTSNGATVISKVMAVPCMVKRATKLAKGQGKLGL